MTRTTNDLDFLIKLLNMAADHSNEHQSQEAWRKANSWMKKCGWEWETLLKGKVTVMANPFAAAPVAAPPPRSSYAPSAPPRPQAPPPPSAPPQPQTTTTWTPGRTQSHVHPAPSRTAKPRKSKVTMSAADAADILKNLGL